MSREFSTTKNNSRKGKDADLFAMGKEKGVLGQFSPQA